jgi:hypothetical protein
VRCVLGQKTILIEHQWLQLSDLPHAGGIFHRVGWYIKRLQDLLESSLIFNNIEHLGQRH